MHARAVTAPSPTKTSALLHRIPLAVLTWPKTATALPMRCAMDELAVTHMVTQMDVKTRAYLATTGMLPDSFAGRGRPRPRPRLKRSTAGEH